MKHLGLVSINVSVTQSLEELFQSVVTIKNTSILDTITRYGITELSIETLN